jgi:uncharacterized damage-inducible protein DinB
MRAIFKYLFLTITLLFATTTIAQEPVLAKEFVGQAVFVQGRLVDLANAVPQVNYSWRPEEGVRSVAEVYLHAAFGNYIFVTVSGGTVPEDVGFEMDFSKAKAWDTQTTDKTEIIEILNVSFEVLKERMGNLTEEDLNREVEIFGMRMSVRNFSISMIGHAHEHLGQSIAYARINGVTPPWSEKDEDEG